MADVLPSSPGSPRAPAALRLEVVRGLGRLLELDPSDGLLIGSVAGCDLRVPGTGLPPVICLLSVASDGLCVRKLAPAFTLRLNGEALTTDRLQPEDRLTIGGVELVVRGSLAKTQAGPVFRPILAEIPAAPALSQTELGRQQLELAQLRQQYFEQHQQRRDRLAGMKDALDQAAKKIQERKRALDAEAAQAEARRHEDQERQTRLERQARELDRARQELDDHQRALEAHRADLTAREQRFADDRAALEKRLAEFQDDLVRLERARAAFDLAETRRREQQAELDRRSEQLHRDTETVENRTRELAALEARLHEQQGKQDAVTSQLGERVAALETQQATLTELRARLDRTREELRSREQVLAEERARHQLAVEELDRQRTELQQQRAETERERQQLEQDRQRLEDQNAQLQAEVERYRPQMETLAAAEEKIRQQSATVEAEEKRQQQQEELLKARSAQLLEMHERLTTDRQALREREAGLLRAEQAREALQEQLRKRSEELAERQKATAEQMRLRMEEITALETRRVELEREHVQERERLAALQQELEQRTNDLAGRERDWTQCQADWLRRLERVKDVARAAARGRKSFASRRSDWLEHRAQEEATLTQARAELEQIRAELDKEQEQVPELELRAQAASDSLAAARSQLLAHLEELHTFARLRREDLEALRGEVRAEAEGVRLQALALHRARDEHRLAVAGFRQQLIAWQGQVAELKRALATDESRLERREAKVEEAVRAVDATSARLAVQAEQLQEQEREVAVRRTEVDRHLSDMREWYRRKLRELAAGALAEVPAPSDPEEPRGILALTGDVDPGDRQLGDLLRSLELVDADTLTTLLAEARRQRRSLRQVLLSSGHVTLYQLALIEAGDVDKLVLGPVRVVDRLRATPREAVYRVFDPRRAGSAGHAVLRHLAEAEMQDAVRPDEFRQRFAALAAVQHANLAATYEVLEIAGRPAALQEWVAGLPSSDWADLVAVPGICHRLLQQAALGLHAAHQAGLVHGRLDAAALILTGEGTLKVCGVGEPTWLAGATQPTAADDLRALAKLAQEWLALLSRTKPVRTQPAKPLFDLVEHLAAGDRYSSAAELLSDLDAIANDVPPNAEAWERLLRIVRKCDDGVRQSA